MKLAFTELVNEIEARHLAMRGVVLDSTLSLTSGFEHESGNFWVLVGFTGARQWPHFMSSTEANDGQPNPLDRWSMRLLEELARRFGADAVNPNDSRLPLQRLALAAGNCYPTPLGLLIDHDYGLWHAYRGALRFNDSHSFYQYAQERTAQKSSNNSPCDSCLAKPCLNGCPVGAFDLSGFRVELCLSHLDTPAGQRCLTQGCQARKACPKGDSHRYSQAQQAFHIEAFHRAVSGANYVKK